MTDKKQTGNGETGQNHILVHPLPAATESFVLALEDATSSIAGLWLTAGTGRKGNNPLTPPLERGMGGFVKGFDEDLCPHFWRVENPPAPFTRGRNLQ